jgi:vacuolar-type H+-ATPase subunit I/STV1
VQNSNNDLEGCINQLISKVDTIAGNMKESVLKKLKNTIADRNKFVDSFHEYQKKNSKKLQSLNNSILEHNSKTELEDEKEYKKEAKMQEMYKIEKTLITHTKESVESKPIRLNSFNLTISF